MSDYEIKSISHENLIVNPENPRYHTKKKLTDEWDAIFHNVKDFRDYIFRLSSDIAEDGLIGSQLPIVMEVAEDKKLYRVYDGNLRITSIKIITTYKDDLDKLPFTVKQREKLSSMKYNGDRINCAVYRDIEVVRRELRKIHISNTGLGPKLWEGTAQDVYEFDGIIKLKKRFIVLEFMKSSKYTTQDVKEAMEKTRWIRQFEVIINNSKYASIFGISYSENGRLMMHFEEKVVINRLSRLIMDSVNKTAAEMVQPADVRTKYLQDLVASFGITRGNIRPLKNCLFFNILTKQVTKSSYMVNNEEVIKNITFFLPPQVIDNNNQKDNNASSKIAPSYDNNGANHGGKKSKQHSPTPKGVGQGKTEDTKGLETTQERGTLIPENQILRIDNQRTNDLFEELKEIDVNKYTNTVSLAFRSLIEFSVNFFLEKNCNNLAFNEQFPLIKKIEKTLGKLESMVADSNLIKNDLAWLYNSLASYNASKTHDINSVGQLHIIIHSHKFCPSAIELKTLYNNYHHYLEYLWGDYKNN